MFRAFIDVWFIFAPSAGYILQVQEMNRSRRTDGYSLEGSLLMLVCNALRIIYFFGEPFAVALLLQSVITISVQTALVLTVLKINMAKAVISEDLAHLPSWVPTGGSFATSPSIVTAAGSALQKVANRAAPAGVASWTPRQFLTRFLVSFCCAFLFCMFTFSQFSGAEKLLGYLAMGVESTLIIPQLLLNHRRKSCEGLALSLVGNWILGDITKTIYFVVLSQPAPFLLCAFSQLALDGVLIHQLVKYRPVRTPPSASTAIPIPTTPVLVSASSSMIGNPLVASLHKQTPSAKSLALSLTPSGERITPIKDARADSHASILILGDPSAPESSPYDPTSLAAHVYNRGHYGKRGGASLNRHDSEGDFGFSV
jgi:hypothetical protein